MDKKIIEKIQNCGTDKLTKEKTLEEYKRLCSKRKNLKLLGKLLKGES